MELVIVAMAVYASLLGVLGVLWWTSRHAQGVQAHNTCGSCGYGREGLAIDACCPECGKRAWEPSNSKRTGNWIQRVAVSAIPPCIAGVVAVAGASADDVLQIVSVAVFPHAVSFLLFLWMTRTLSINKAREWAVVLGGSCAVVMAAVMAASRIWPWAFMDEVIDHGNLTMLSALYFWLFMAFAGAYGVRSLCRVSARLKKP